MVNLVCLIGVLGVLGAYSAGTRPVSPAVVATWISSAERIELAVLWRGTPYWFSKVTGEATDKRNGTIAVRVAYRQVTLDLSFDSSSRQLRLQGQLVDLGKDANVVLMDDVDSEGGPRLVQVLTVSAPPDGSNANPVAFMLRHSPEAVAFLRCDVSSNDPTTQRIFRQLCAEVIGK